VRKDRFLIELILLALIGGVLGVSCSAGAVLGGLSAMILPNYVKAKDKRREREVKANIRTIQIALERYATDNDGTYPKYIWGGDQLGWEAFYMEGPRQGTETAIYDPLVRYGYLESYPRNPFVRDGKSVVEKTSAFRTDGFQDWLGTGDPRFGYSGTLMGNGLSDPRYPECDDTLGGAENGNWGYGTSPSIKRKPGHTWTMGGWWNEKKGKTVSTHWPGNFFYRSAGEHALTASLKTGEIARHAQINSADYTGDAALIVSFGRPDTYMLGGYGNERTIGYDVIRMGDYETGEGGFAFRGAQDTDPIRYYHTAEKPGEPSLEHPIMYPEIFGKGENLNYPLWPYRSFENDSFLYASPDGSPDGVILTIVNSHQCPKSPSPEEIEQEQREQEKWKLEHGKGPEQAEY